MARPSSIAVAIGSLFLVAACSEQKPPAPALVQAPTGGRLTLSYSTVADLKPVSATLTTRDMGEARARLSGILVSLLVREGDQVSQGQVIATVKDDRLALVTASYDAQVAAAAAESARAQADLARTRSLFNQGIYARARMDLVEAMAKAALAAGLVPIVCVGETLEEREAGKTAAVVTGQVQGSLAGLSPAELEKIVVAYEPVWAIGTGKVATPEQAQEVHALIRGLLAKLSSPEIAARVRIQYGGSVKPDNAADLARQPDIDGALVGGASLKADDFLGIAKAFG